MAKPEKVRSSGAAVLADGIQLLRVQNLSTDTDISREQVLELANSGVVQYIEASPSVNITVDTNSYGSIDNIRLLTAGYFARTAASNFVDNRTGIFSSKLSTPNAAINVTESNLLDGYCTLAVPVLEASTTVARTLVVPRAAISGYSLNFDVGGAATENFTLQAANKDWFLSTWRDVRVFRLSNYHIGTPEAYGNYARMKRKNNDSWAYSATSQAFGRLASALASTTKGSGYSAANVRPWWSGASGSITPVGMIINDRVYRSTGNAFSGGRFYFSTGWVGNTAPGTVFMGITGNVPPGYSTPYAKSGDDVWLIYRPQRNQTWAGSTDLNNHDPGYALTSTSGSYGAVGKGYVDIYLWNQKDLSGDYLASTTVGRTLRLQTVGIDVSLSTEALDELGNFQSYALIRQTPIPVTVTVTANDSDLESWAHAMNLASASAIDTGVKHLHTEMFKGDNALRIDVFKDKAKSKKLQTILATKLVVNSESHSVSVGGIASQELTFQGDNIKITGTGTNPNT